MTDEQMYKEIEQFANDHTLSKDIVVTISQGSTSMEAINDAGAKYDDAVLLSHIINGAESYLMWKRRK